LETYTILIVNAQNYFVWEDRSVLFLAFLLVCYFFSDINIFSIIKLITGKDCAFDSFISNVK